MINDLPESIFKNFIVFIISEIFIKTGNNKHLDGSFYYPKYGFGSIFNRIRDNIGSENDWMWFMSSDGVSLYNWKKYHAN